MTRTGCNGENTTNSGFPQEAWGCSGGRDRCGVRRLPRPGQIKTARAARLIFDTAAATAGVGAIQEALKWGQPSYLTAESKSGSTIRIDQVKAEAGQYAVYFHCQTDLVETFREIYPELRYGGNRSILLDAGEKLPEKALRHCVALALTYHARKRKAEK